MTNQIASRGRARLGHKRLTIGSLVAAVSAVLLALVAVTPASATSIVSLSGTQPYTDGQTITVSGTGVAGNYIGLAQCNSTRGGLSGQFCNGVTDVGPIVVDISGNWSAAIVVNETFDNFNLTTGSANPNAPLQTDCTLEQCQIQASEYAPTGWPPSSPPVATPVGVNISF